MGSGREREGEGWVSRRSCGVLRGGLRKGWSQGCTLILVEGHGPSLLAIVEYYM